MSFPSWNNLKPATKRRILYGLGVTGVIAIGVAAYYYTTNNCGCCGNNNDINNKQRAKTGGNTSKPSCCVPTTSNKLEDPKDATEIKKMVYDRYSETVREFNSNKQQKSADLLAMAFGYTKEDLLECGNNGSNMGLSCGNPTAMAHIKLNETIVDLGCGGGFDCFIASRKVGPNGKVIGIDMSHEMIKKAKANKARNNKNNCQFYLSEIEKMPLQDNSVDCVISNCVLNLVPNKDAAFEEVYRIVKPNGRLAISDIALKKELPSMFTQDMITYIAGYVNCISGAILQSDYETKIKNAGFKEVQFVLKNVDLNVWKQKWTEVVKQSNNNNNNNGGGVETKAATKTVNTGCCGGGDVETNNNVKNKENENITACCGSGQDSTESEEVDGAGSGGGGCCGGPTTAALTGISFTKEQCEKMNQFLENVDLNEYVGSYYIFALK